MNQEKNGTTGSFLREPWGFKLTHYRTLNKMPKSYVNMLKAFYIEKNRRVTFFGL